MWKFRWPDRELMFQRMKYDYNFTIDTFGNHDMNVLVYSCFRQLCSVTGITQLFPANGTV